MIQNTIYPQIDPLAGNRNGVWAILQVRVLRTGPGRSTGNECHQYLGRRCDRNRALESEMSFSQHVAPYALGTSIGLFRQHEELNRALPTHCLKTSLCETPVEIEVFELKCGSPARYAKSSGQPTG